MTDYVPDPTKAFGKDFDILRITDEYAKSFLAQHFTAVLPADSKGTINVNVESDPHAMARNQLLIDGYMIEYPKGSGYFYLTGEGRYFISKGGYAGRAAEREKMNRLSEQQIRSVIKTNYFIWVSIAAIVITAYYQFKSFELSKAIYEIETHKENKSTQTQSPVKPSIQPNPSNAKSQSVAPAK